jgi:hypothetical protein
MGWLIGYTFASMAAAFVVVRIFEFLFSGATSGIAAAVKPGIFVATWTAVTARSGMRSATSWTSRWRRRSEGVIGKMDTIVGEGRFESEKESLR